MKTLSVKHLKKAAKTICRYGDKSQQSAETTQTTGGDTTVTTTTTITHLR